MTGKPGSLRRLLLSGQPQSTVVLISHTAGLRGGWCPCFSSTVCGGKKKSKQDEALGLCGTFMNLIDLSLPAPALASLSPGSPRLGHSVPMHPQHSCCLALSGVCFGPAQALLLLKPGCPLTLFCSSQRPIYSKAKVSLSKLFSEPCI